MVEIIPTILEKDIKGVAEKLSQAEAVATRVQIDIMDGRFVPNKTFFTAEEVSKIETNSDLEIHLMVKNPLIEIPRWSRLAQVKRIYFHVEATKKIHSLINLIKNGGQEVGLAVAPNTHPKELYPYLSKVDDVLFLGVRPGFSGQGFMQKVLLHVRTLRNIAPYLSISLDGGVDDSSAPLIVRAGASRLIASSYLFSAKNIVQAKHILEVLCT